MKNGIFHVKYAIFLGHCLDKKHRIGYNKTEVKNVKVLFIECNMGASGDMILSALSELADNQEKFMSELNNCGIAGIFFYNK